MELSYLGLTKNMVAEMKGDGVMDKISAGINLMDYVSSLSEDMQMVFFLLQNLTTWAGAVGIGDDPLTRIVNAINDSAVHVGIFKVRGVLWGNEVVMEVYYEYDDYTL